MWYHTWNPKKKVKLIEAESGAVVGGLRYRERYRIPATGRIRSEDLM